MEVYLLEFIKNGTFGKLRIGLNKSQVEELILLKNDFIEKDDYWIYKNIELKFNENELVLITIFLNHEGVSFNKIDFNEYYNVIDLERFNYMSNLDFKLLIDSEKLLIFKEFSLSD